MGKRGDRGSYHRHAPSRGARGSRIGRLLSEHGLFLAFGAVAVGAVGLLVAAVLAGPVADAFHPVVSVNGSVFNRSDLRARIALDDRIADARRAHVRTLLTSGRADPGDAARLLAEIDADRADPLRAAVDGLVIDALLLGAVPNGTRPDATSALQEDAIRDAAIRIEAIVVQPGDAPAPARGESWPKAPSRDSTLDEQTRARERLATMLDARLDSGASLADVASSLEGTGWQAAVIARWIGGTGPVARVPDALVVSARAAAGPGALPATVDLLRGTVAAGRVVDIAGPGAIRVETGDVDAGALGRWAAAREAESAQRKLLLAGWQQGPVPQVRAAELVIGPADLEGPDGPWMSFTHLVVDTLPEPVRAGATTSTVAATLADELRALPVPDRAARFSALVAQARSSDPLRASGETPFFTRDQLLPEIATAAFAEGVAVGDVLGPIETSGGTELFLVRAFFDGVLDDRANAALVEARSAPDLLAMARRVAPTSEWPRAAGQTWRAIDEVAARSDQAAAYVATPVGDRSGPVVVDGQIVIVEPLERRSGPLERELLERLMVGGFDVWLDRQQAAASIVRDPEPLPGIGMEQPRASSPVREINPAAIPTPNLPSLAPAH